jgi:potassium-transporting ATPase KdpC subunit
MMHPFKIAINLFILIVLLTGVIYPLLILLIAQTTMSHLANGSLIQTGDRIMGSALLAQKTSDDRYFWPRPSAIDYNPIHPSGGSNLGPTSQKLKEIVNKRKEQLGAQAPPELLYASGSGLDPHISLETAYFQIPRVAKARSMDEAELKDLIHSLLEAHWFGFLGPSYVNVLLLNQSLDDIHDQRSRRRET